MPARHPIGQQTSQSCRSNFIHYNTTEVSDVSSDHFCHSAPAGEAEPRSHRRFKKRFGTLSKRYLRRCAGVELAYLAPRCTFGPQKELPLAVDGQEFSARAWLDGFLREQSRVRTALSLCQGALLDDFAQVVDEANANSMAASLVNPLPAFVSASLL